MQNHTQNEEINLIINLLLLSKASGVRTDLSRYLNAGWASHCGNKKNKRRNLTILSLYWDKIIWAYKFPVLSTDYKEAQDNLCTVPPILCFTSRDVFLAHHLCQTIQIILCLFYCDLSTNKRFRYVHAHISAKHKMVTSKVTALLNNSLFVYCILYKKPTRISRMTA